MSEKHRIMFWKILTGVSGFFILVAGMGLLARLGLQHGQGFPSWVWAKIVIWFFLLGIGHMVAKRLPQHGAKAYALSLVLASLAAYLAINKI